MDSLPPPRRATVPAPGPGWALGPAGTRPEGALSVCFVVGGALEGGATESVDLVGGGVRLTTRVAGQVSEARPEETCLSTRAGAVTLRHLLPAGLDLRPLVGHRVSVRVDHTLAEDTTVDARIWAEDGRLLVWARDGRLPGREAPVPVSPWALHAADRPPRLVLSLGPRLLAPRPGEVRELSLAGSAYRLWVLRVEGRTASFLLVAAGASGAPRSP